MSITINSLRSSANISGFKYVVRAGGMAGWQASRNGGGRPDGWRGPLRKTPQEAAQDYCDYINGNPSIPSSKLKTANHEYNIDEHSNDPEVEAALGVLRDYRAQQAGKQGYVYLITDGTAYKIGYSVNPKKRVAELQTGNPRPLKLVAFFKGDQAAEKGLHTKYIDKNLLQEWFVKADVILAEFKTKE